jgi:hypothetical protein
MWQCRKKLSGIFVISLLLFAVSSFAQTNGLISEATIIPPSYADFKPPKEVGGNYVDPAFSTRIFRVTNCGDAGPNAFGGYFGNSEICVFNVDGSYFLAMENVDVSGTTKIITYLYNGVSGARLKYIGEDTMRPWWIRWAIANKYKKNGAYVQFDPVYCFYKYEGNEIRLYDVRDMSSYVLLRKFDEYNEIGPAGGEGDISDNGRYWCVDGDSRELFVYDLIDDIKYPASTFDLGSLGSQGAAIGVDYAAVSPTGNYVVVSWTTEPAERRYHGIEVYDKQWNFIRQVHPGIMHWELGIDAFGNEVIYTAAGFKVPEYFTSRGANPGDVISVRLSDGYLRLLTDMKSWAPAMMSACNSVTNGRYLYISFTARSEDPESVWAPYWGEIVEVPTDGSGQARRLVHHRSREVPGQVTKFWQADAVVNRQGTKILYRSTYGGSSGDLYMFDLGNRDGHPVDTTLPNPPQNLQNASSSYNSIHLEWDPPLQAEDGDYASFYRIVRDGQHITDVIETQYLDTDLQEATTYQYQVYSIDKVGQISLGAAAGSFTTQSDDIPPTLESVQVINRSSLKIRFSEAIDKMAAEDESNYNISDQIEIKQAVLLEDSMTVKLTISPINLSAFYELHVYNVTDLSIHRNRIADGSSISFRLVSDFFDGFNSEISEEWIPLHADRWSIQSVDGENVLSLNTSAYESPGGKLLGEYVLLNKSLYYGSNFVLACDIKSAENLSDNPHADYSFVFAFQDSLNYYYVQFHDYDISVNQITGGDRTFLNKYPITIGLSDFHNMGIKVKNDSISVSVDRQYVLAQQLDAELIGQIGLGSFNDAVYFDSFNLKSLAEDTTPPSPPMGLTLQP